MSVASFQHSQSVKSKSPLTTRLDLIPWGNGGFLGPGGDNNNFPESEDEDDDLSMREESAAGIHCVVTIPVKSIKQGGLRLFIMLYMMGMQNTPDPGSWKADQPSKSEYVVDLYYKDGSAILSVELTEDSIIVSRVGSSPSTAYTMQESSIVQGILDELRVCAFDENVALENRLLVLKEDDAIDKAQSMLSFG